MQNGMGPGFSSSAVDALGLGAALSDQVKGETDEERKKRLAMSGSPLANYSPAASMLLGARGGGLGG